MKKRVIALLLAAVMVVGGLLDAAVPDLRAERFYPYRSARILKLLILH